ncbi:hypothetical protein [Cupriavidus nantongensis]|uniref:Uncharacterized protein n=1 Tax=Cupriavidus nantongensis TaxID=1796606 RepID=A0A142JNH5_9BURK|nr:hypothetical protein [Cupriavidus nantongensis]AMR79637.1 hypothetical protein A2G96_18835 [Cupriavidus nantongensis]
MDKQQLFAIRTFHKDARYHGIALDADQFTSGVAVRFFAGVEAAQRYARLRIVGVPRGKAFRTAFGGPFIGHPDSIERAAAAFEEGVLFDRALSNAAREFRDRFLERFWAYADKCNRDIFELESMMKDEIAICTKAAHEDGNPILPLEYPEHLRKQDADKVDQLVHCISVRPTQEFLAGMRGHNTTSSEAIQYF